MEDSTIKTLNTRYIQLLDVLDPQLALFCICATMNLKYDPEIDFVSFEDYKEQMERKHNRIRFKDGILKAEVAPTDPAKQLEHWHRVWGTGNENNPYTEEDYERLDETFYAYSSRLERAGGMDALQEDTLRKCSKMRLHADKLLERGGKDHIAMAATLNKMIQEDLKSEQLRKADAKPIETARIDGIVDALTKKYGISIECTYEEAVAACAKWLTSHRYPMTTDAANYMLEAIINCTRENNDMAALPHLPKHAKITEEMGFEVAEDPNEAEDEVFEYLKLNRRKNITE